MEIGVHAGDLVAVIINKDPMGMPDRWFVDSGGLSFIHSVTYLIIFSLRTFVRFFFGGSVFFKNLSDCCSQAMQYNIGNENEYEYEYIVLKMS